MHDYKENCVIDIYDSPVSKITSASLYGDDEVLLDEFDSALIEESNLERKVEILVERWNRAAGEQFDLLGWEDEPAAIVVASKPWRDDIPGNFYVEVKVSFSYLEALVMV